MAIQTLSFAKPFFQVLLLENEKTHFVSKKTILLNLAKKPILIEQQKLSSLQSVIVCNIEIKGVERAVLIENFDVPNDAELLEKIKLVWKLAYDIRKEERLKNVKHYLSPKEELDNLNLSMYLSDSVPLNVGLHKFHPFSKGAGFREVHTQIIGYGKMQQCREQDLATLYLEEIMAPGITHKPMYDEQGNYPWHQFETITPSVFMATEFYHH